MDYKSIPEKIHDIATRYADKTAFKYKQDGRWVEVRWTEAYEVINRVALGMVIRAGVNAPIVNAAEVKQSILAADLLLGRDQYAMNYIKYYREHKK